MLTEGQVATIRNWIRPEILQDVYNNDLSEWSENLIYVLITNNEPELQESVQMLSGTNVTLSQIAYTEQTEASVRIDPVIVKKIDEMHKMMLEFTKEIE